MNKLAKALGTKYQEHRLSVLTRTFELGEHTFKVRVPAVHEIEAIYNYFKNPDEAKIELAYKELIKDLPKDSEINGDVVVEGRSMREAAKNRVVFEHRMVEFFKLLIPESGESLADLEYKDIADEFPLPVQLQIVDAINEAISPNYEGVRGK